MPIYIDDDEQFDARTAKALAPGEHMLFQGRPGLRLVASGAYRTWIYRYKSPVIGGMKQIKISRYPELNLLGAVRKWEGLKEKRDKGLDPAQVKRSERVARKEQEERDAAARTLETYTVHKLCDDFVARLARSRGERSVGGVERMLASDKIKSIAARPATSVTRAMAFDLIESYAHAPVQAKVLCRELGKAWHTAMNAGRLPEATRNWWRELDMSSFVSKGKRIGGEYMGPDNRHLEKAEIKELLHWLPNFSETVRDVLKLYLGTGTRGAEIVRMEAH